MWIFGFVLLVFGIEFATRGIGKNRFSRRGRWNITICWAIVGLMLLLSWIPTMVRSPIRDHCLADLLVFVFPWADIAFGLSLALIVSYLIITFTLTIQLYRTVEIERPERIAASRMVYYLVLGAIIFVSFSRLYRLKVGLDLPLQALVVPLWAAITFRAPNEIELKYTIAIVALNIFGILNVFLHLLLRANPDSMAIYPRKASWQRNEGWRLFGANALQISPPLESRVGNPFYKSEWNPIDSEVGVAVTINPAKEYKKVLPLPPAFTPAKEHRRKGSNYSVFPTKESARVDRTSLSTIEGSSVDGDSARLSSSSLQAPQPLFVNGHRRRQNSEMSTATVQIGLRLSNFESPPEGFASSPTQPNRNSGPFLGLHGPSSLREVVSTASHDTYDISVASGYIDNGSASPAIKEAFLAPPAKTQAPTAKPKLVSLPSSPKAAKTAKQTIDKRLTMKNLPPYPAPVAKTNEPGTIEWPLSNPKDSTEALLPRKVYNPASGWI